MLRSLCMYSVRCTCAWYGYSLCISRKSSSTLKLIKVKGKPQKKYFLVNSYSFNLDIRRTLTKYLIRFYMYIVLLKYLSFFNIKKKVRVVHGVYPPPPLLVVVPLKRQLSSRCLPELMFVKHLFLQTCIRSKFS